MKKAEFMETLARHLASLSEREREKMLEYYSEMIDDCMEEGMDEEEAVRTLGDPEKLARDAAPYDSVSPEGKPCTSGMTFSEPIHAVSIDCADLGFRVLPGLLADGTSARLECPPGKAELLSWTLTDGTLEIRRISPNTARRVPLLAHFAPPRPCVLTVRSSALERLQMRSISGDLDVQGLELSETLSINTVSGDILAANLHTEGTATLKSRSGDIALREVSSEEVLNVSVSSGDILLEQVEAARLDLHAASGDIRIRDAKAEEIQCQSTSGDLDLTCLESDGLLSLSTASGDIELGGSRARTADLSATSGDIDLDQAEVEEGLILRLASGDATLNHVSADQMDISASSGDVSGILSGGADAYDFRATSHRGDVHVPMTRGPRIVNVTTTSGDIKLRAE